MAGKEKYVLLISIFFITFTCSKGEIKNGYSSQIRGMRESLKTLNTLINGDANLSLSQKVGMRDNINKLVAYISYFELTEELLDQFESIAPAMYNEIDNLKDNIGQNVTVYVKFVPEEEMQLGAAGTTNLAHADNDKNIYTSEYGPLTVSVKIASVAKALLLLAHEFGHVKYQVANLSSYVEFYSTYYQSSTFNSKYIGHNSNDPSGQSATEFENLFRVYYLNFLKAKSLRPENPLARLNEIRKTFTGLE